jgi:large subunit ribosomal protein L20
MAEGYWGLKSVVFRRAKEAVIRALNFAYRDRKQRKRDFRRWWIVRINAAARLHGLRYNEFIHGLKLAGVTINRKMLADLAVNDPDAFAALAEKAKEALAAKAATA